MKDTKERNIQNGRTPFQFEERSNKINKIIQELRQLEYQIEGKSRYTFDGERVDLWVVIDNLVAEMLVLKGVGASQEELDFIKRWEV